MKALFFYPELTQEFRYPDWLETGVAAEALRGAGWRIEGMYWKAARLRDRLLRLALQSAPDLIVAPLRADQAPFAVEFLREYRAQRADTALVATGLWPTLEPEAALGGGLFDAAIAGEWELALLEFAAALRRPEAGGAIANVIRRGMDGRLAALSCRPPARPLDSLPAPARDLFPMREILEINGGEMPIAASRGCPFHCAFCAGPAVRRVTGAPEGEPRRRSPERVVEEAVELTRFYSPARFVFVDEMFPWDTHWLGAFADLWERRVALPITVTTCAEHATPPMLELLHRAGCDRVVLGVEVGDENFRRALCDRNVGNASLFALRQRLDALSMEMITTNLIGLPGETPQHLEATFELNRSLDPIEIRTRVYDPVAQTPVGDFAAREAIRRSGAAPAAPTSEVREPDVSRLELPQLSQKEISRMFDRLALLDSVLRARRRWAEPPTYFDLLKEFAEGKFLSPWRRAARLDRWRHGRETREVLALRAPAEIYFDFEARPQTGFTFGAAPEPTLHGLRPHAPIQFSVKITQDGRTLRIFRKFLVPALDPDARRWHDYLFPLKEARPGPCRITLQIRVEESDLRELPPGVEIWGGWSEPRLIEMLPSAEMTPRVALRLDRMISPKAGAPEEVAIAPGAGLESERKNCDTRASTQLREARKEIDRMRRQIHQAGEQDEAWRQKMDIFAARLADLQRLLSQTEEALEEAERRAGAAAEEAEAARRRLAEEERKRFHSTWSGGEKE